MLDTASRALLMMMGITSAHAQISPIGTGMPVQNPQRYPVQNPAVTPVAPAQPTLQPQNPSGPLAPPSKDSFNKSPAAAIPAAAPATNSQKQLDEFKTQRWVTNLDPELRRVYEALLDGHFNELPQNLQDRFPDLYKAEIAEMDKSKKGILTKDPGKAMSVLANLGSALNVIPIAVSGSKMLGGLPIEGIQKAQAFQTILEKLGSKSVVALCKVAGRAGAVSWMIMSWPKYYQLHEQAMLNGSNGQEFAAILALLNGIVSGGAIFAGEKLIPFTSILNIIGGGLFGNGVADLNAKAAGLPHNRADFTHIYQGKQHLANGEYGEGLKLMLWGEGDAMWHGLQDFYRNNGRLKDHIKAVGVKDVLFEQPIPENTPASAVQIPKGLKVENKEDYVERRKIGAANSTILSTAAADGFTAAGIVATVATFMPTKIMPTKSAPLKWGLFAFSAVPSTIAFALQTRVQLAKAKEHADLGLPSAKTGQAAGWTDLATGIPALAAAPFNDKPAIGLLSKLIAVIRTGPGDALNTRFNTADAQLHAKDEDEDEKPKTPAAEPSVAAAPPPNQNPFRLSPATTSANNFAACSFGKDGPLTHLMSQTQYSHQTLPQRHSH